tara:strand:- start:798 stop:968 length:171 start_codon:yes stop_codon:yes gene_type:complete
MIGVFIRGAIALAVAVFLLLLFTSLVSDVYLMLSVSDEQSNSLFMEDVESWDTVQR